ncbi:HAMP domain-containing sensor histidine kinase [Anaeromicropila populeti]|uniref:histidine kinase n=1 Tax=Anaeromicropila populeti TaxID=37658 RepID=A0A1I6J9U3_9FIRM|nr:ATP-binding protein [Anaeromicropila populeti]SFR75729.1 two-component system, OmpR family, phosphate regulon sensor histidine kinase PhoR [Anaeromicropila populeti]
MRKKLIVSYVVLIIIAIGISSLSYWTKEYEYLNEKSSEYYLLQAKLLGDVLENSNISDEKDYKDFVQRYAKEYQIRITLISRDGSVVADSDKEQLENHGSREEVVKALRGESVTVTRYSKTMQQDYSYSAVPITTENFQGVMRISLPLSDLKKLNEDFAGAVSRNIFVCLLIAVILAVVFTRFISNPIVEVTKAAEKISNGSYGIKIYTREKSELGRLASSFNVMSENLEKSITGLTQRNIELEAMLRSMNSSVVAIDEDNVILFYNEAFAKLSGKSENLRKQYLYNVFRSGVIFQVLDAVKEKKETVVEEGCFLTDTEDQDRLLRITGTPLCKADGEILGILFIMEDITQIKKLETIRSDFVSNVTHELKTPLTSIRGFIDTLKNGAISDPAAAARFLDIIDIEADRLYSLIQDILTLSEIEQKKEYVLVPVNVNECIQEVINLLNGNKKEQVVLIYEPVPYVKPFMCNPIRLRQLIINLLDNAMKYTEEGTIQIFCWEKENVLNIKIADTGIGMQKEHLSRIFERFYRVDKGRSRKQGGTGLGLSIVKHIVELYGGNIIVESEKDKGTTFLIKLPY